MRGEVFDVFKSSDADIFWEELGKSSPHSVSPYVHLEKSRLAGLL
jgi:hypothetical protein